MKSIRKLGGEDKEDKLQPTVTGTNTKVEEIIHKSLKDRDIEERERQNRRKNIIVLDSQSQTNPNQRPEGKKISGRWKDYAETFVK